MRYTAVKDLNTYGQHKIRFKLNKTIHCIPYELSKITDGDERWNTPQLVYSSGNADMQYKDKFNMASIDASNYSDYPTRVQTHGKLYTQNRRTLHHKRHAEEGIWQCRLYTDMQYKFMM